MIHVVWSKNNLSVPPLDALDPLEPLVLLRHYLALAIFLISRFKLGRQYINLTQVTIDMR